MAAYVDLGEAVKEAVREVAKEEQKTETAETAETKTEEAKVEEKKEELTAEQQAYQEKVDKAVRLYDALSDPNVGRSVVEELARKAGVIGVEQGKSTQEIEKSVVDTLKESLGAEYEFLADKLAVGLDKIIKRTVAEQIKPVQAQTNEAIERAVKADVDSAYAQMEAKFKDFKDYDKEMTELSKELPYTGDYPMERYLERLYKLVTADKKEAKVIKQTVDKINKNAQELRDSSTEVQENRVKKGSKLPSLNEAVAAAFRNERLV